VASQRETPKRPRHAEINDVHAPPPSGKNSSARALGTNHQPPPSYHHIIMSRLLYFHQKGTVNDGAWRSDANDEDRDGTVRQHFNGLAPKNDRRNTTPTM
jgi:hypothetical protein